MLTNLKSKLVAMLFVGATWLGGHGGCDGGGLYDSFGSYFYGDSGGYYGDYYYEDDYYYDDYYDDDYYYDGGYYDPYGGWGWW